MTITLKAKQVSLADVKRLEAMGYRVVIVIQ